MNFGPSETLRCPECGSPHHFSNLKIFTSTIKNGRYVAVESGSECYCINPKCRCHFAATDQGVKPLEKPLGYPQNTTVAPPATDEPDGPPQVFRMTPRERKAGV